MSREKQTPTEIVRRSQTLDWVSGAVCAQSHIIVRRPQLLCQQVTYHLTLLEEAAGPLRPILERGEVYHERLGRPWLSPLEITPRPRPTLTLSGHLNSVTDCAFSSNGRLAVSAGQDLTVRVWDISSGQMLQVMGVPAVLNVPKDPRALAQYALARMLTGYSAAVRACAISKDGRFAISVGPGEELAVWDIETASEICRIKDIEGHIQSCAIHGEAVGLVVYACTDEGAYLGSVHRLPIGEKIQTLRMGEDTAQTIVTPDGRLMVSFNSRGDLRMTEIPEDSRAAARELLWLGRHDRSGGVDTRGRVVALGNRHLLIASGKDILVGAIGGGKPPYALEGHGSLVTCCAVMPEGPLAASAGMDKTARIWDLEQGQEVMRVESDETIHACAISPNGDRLLTADGALLTEDFSGRSGVLQMWRIRQPSAPARAPVSRSPVKFFCPIPGGRLLLSIQENGEARFHSLDRSEHPAPFRLQTETVEECILADGGKLFYAGKDRILRLIRLGREGQGERLTASRVSLLTVSPDGRRLGLLSGGDTVEIWNTQTNEKLTSCPCPQGAINRLLFGPDSKQLYVMAETGIATASPGDGNARVFLDGAATVAEAWGHLRHHLGAEDVPARPLSPEQYFERFEQAGITPDGRRLFTASRLVPRGDPYAFQFVITERGMDSARHLDPFPSYALWSEWSVESHRQRLRLSAIQGDPRLVIVDPKGSYATWVTSYMQAYSIRVFDLERGGRESGRSDVGSGLPVKCAVLPGSQRLVTIDQAGQLSVHTLPELRVEMSAWIDGLGLSCAVFAEPADVIALGHDSGAVEIFQRKSK